MENRIPAGTTSTVAQPKVTIVICAYNAGRFLLDSVHSALHQTWGNLEVILVDDGSTDGSTGLIREIRDPRLRILHQQNAGKPAALNLALSHLTGEFYAIQDADDLSYPDRIERQARCLMENPDVAGVFCGFDLLIGDKRLAPRSAAKSVDQCRHDIERLRMPGHDPTAMYRVELVKEFRYDPKLPVVEGVDYVLRIGERHPLMVCGATLYSYRVNLDGVTLKDPSHRLKCLQRALSIACARRGVPLERLPPALRRSFDRPLRVRDRDNNIAAHFMESVLDQRRSGRRWDAVRTGLYCASLHPFQPHYLKALIYSMAPLWMIPFLRRNAD